MLEPLIRMHCHKASGWSRKVSLPPGWWSARVATRRNFTRSSARPYVDTRLHQYRPVDQPHDRQWFVAVWYSSPHPTL